MDRRALSFKTSRSSLQGICDQRLLHRRSVGATATAQAGQKRAEVGGLLVRPASNEPELRAAASLRAVSFFTYPADRSAFSTQRHQQMKADSEVDELRRKLAGTALGYEAVVVSCLLAAKEDSTPSGRGQQAGTEALMRLPAEPDTPPLVVVGTLDVNYGVNLPSEELVGALPQERARQGRAYLSNVCVSQTARRQGVARTLIQEAELIARRQGTQHLYVHVVHDNEAAVRLYTGLGFALESQEPEALAHALGRPRRLLLGKALAR